MLVKSHLCRIETQQQCRTATTDNRILCLDIQRNITPSQNKQRYPIYMYTLNTEQTHTHIRTYIAKPAQIVALAFN